MDYVESVKPFCTYQQQIDKLEARGLIVRDKAYAESVLRSENYYRLRGYWLTMVKSRAPLQTMCSIPERLSKTL